MTLDDLKVTHNQPVINSGCQLPKSHTILMRAYTYKRTKPDEVG